MTNEVIEETEETEKTETDFDEVVKAMDEMKAIGDLQKMQKDGRPEVKKKTREELMNYAYQNYVKWFEVDKETKKPENLTQEEYEKGLNAGITDAQERAYGTFSGKLEKILDENQMPDKTIDALALDEIIQKNVPNKNKKSFESYRLLKTIEGFARQYSENEDFEVNYNDKKDVLSRNVILAVGAEIGKEAAEKAKKLGYSEDFQEYMKSLARVVARGRFYNNEQMRKYATEGFKVLAEETKTKYESYDEDGREVVKETIRKVAEETIGEEFNKLVGSVYRANFREPEAGSEELEADSEELEAA